MVLSVEGGIMDYWELKYHKDNEQKLTETEKEHIAYQIRQGYTGGEVLALKGFARD